jgi:hypothetical protein
MKTFVNWSRMHSSISRRINATVLWTPKDIDQESLHVVIHTCLNLPDEDGPRIISFGDLVKRSQFITVLPDICKTNRVNRCPGLTLLKFQRPIYHNWARL